MQIEIIIQVLLVTTVLTVVMAFLLMPNIMYMITRTPFYELRLINAGVFIKKTYKSQRHNSRTFDIRKYGTFVYPTKPDEYFVKGISKIVHYEIDKANPMTSKKPDMTPVKGKVKRQVKKGDETTYEIIPTTMHPGMMNPTVLKELLKDESVKKVMKQPKSSLDAWIPIFIIIAILGVVVLAIVVITG